MSNKGKIVFGDGLVWKFVGGKRIPINTFEEAQEELAKCCGISCCNNHIRLIDKITGLPVLLTIENGEPVISSPE